MNVSITHCDNVLHSHKPCHSTGDTSN